MKQPQLLTPLSERRSCLRDKNALNGSFAGAALLAELLQRPWVSGIGQQRSDHSQGPPIHRMGQLERYGTSRFQLIGDEGKLGFQFVSNDAYALVVRANATTIRIAKAQNFTPALYTVMGWEVKDTEAVVAWLKQRGVTLEKYPFIQDQELGIWTTPNGDKVAWFKDPDGNLLSISQHT
jgi:hypothetical protein